MPRELERYQYFVEIVLESASGKRDARISDISAGGCYIDTIVRVYEGEEIAFEFKEPTGENLRFTGTVAYVLEGMGFGIKYTNLTDAHQAVIDQIIKSSGG
jgi:hypothetical protein